MGNNRTVRVQCRVSGRSVTFAKQWGMSHSLFRGKGGESSILHLGVRDKGGEWGYSRRIMSRTGNPNFLILMLPVICYPYIETVTDSLQ